MGIFLFAFFSVFWVLCRISLMISSLVCFYLHFFGVFRVVCVISLVISSWVCFYMHLFGVFWVVCRISFMFVHGYVSICIFCWITVVSGPAIPHFDWIHGMPVTSQVSLSTKARTDRKNHLVVVFLSLLGFDPSLWFSTHFIDYEAISLGFYLHLVGCLLSCLWNFVYD